MENLLPREQLDGIKQRMLSAFDLSEPGELAKRLGIPYQTLQHYFLGRTPIPVQLLLHLSAEARVSIHWILTGEGEKHPGNSRAQSQQFGNQLDERREKQRDIFDLVAQFKELPDEDKIALSNKIVGLVANYLLSACNITEIEPARIEIIPILAINPSNHIAPSPK
ncbi:MAG: helix-turn-helix domain-containing protein [Blastocatellia bacterium]|nr:helix-turn-helix domain-containing protein [Blastocatellia bacterium]